MGNMRFKVGDRVRIKSLDWYDENKDDDGIVVLSTHVFIPEMVEHCGTVVTIKDVFEDTDDNAVYYMKEIDWDWTDEMIEGLAEEEIIDIDDFQDDNEIIDVIDEYVHRLKNNECQINLPEGYQFTDENGNVINAMKIVLEKKKKEYPKTFMKCCEILDISSGLLASYDIGLLKKELLSSLQKLLICRDAYWKIAGEEMGFGENLPWIPDWTLESSKYIILFKETKIEKHVTCKYSRALAFPTAEMRDAFYENFKELIESVKELL